MNNAILPKGEAASKVSCRDRGGRQPQPFLFAGYRSTLLITTMAILFLSGCMGIKPGATKSGSTLYETFYVGDEGTQYFIKPLRFAGNNNDELLMDFTFRYKDSVKDSVTCNFSIVSDEKTKKVEDVSFTAEDRNVKCEFIALLFFDKKGNKFISRFSGRLLFADFNRLFHTGNFTVEADHVTYTIPPKTQKSVKELQKKIFVLFD